MDWLRVAAEASLVAAGVCAATVAVDILRGRRQPMAVMNIVWPVTALWAGPLGLWAYFRFGRAPRGGQGRREKPFWQMAATAATHCGAGCTLGDILAEWIHFAAPFRIAGVALFGAWALDFGFAFALGVAFQYFTIAPMRHLSPARGLAEALKADSLSLTAWQAGMYGWMALMRFAVFGHPLAVDTPVFWFLMQMAMGCGFATSYPVNWWLVKAGVKEKM